MSTLRERAAPLRRGLARLRSRARALMLVLGTSRVVAYVAAALLILFAADYFLRPPLLVSRIAGVALLVGLAAVVVRHLLRPLLVPLTDERLAARVERAHPDLRDRLASSLAFARAEDDPENDDSRVLMGAVVDVTAALAGRIPFAEVARARPALRWAGAAAGLLAVIVAAAAIRPDLFSIFVSRDLLWNDVAWPRRTTLEVVDMEPGVPRRVTRGRETTIQVRAHGTAPERVVFTFWEPGARNGRRERLDLAPAGEDGALFSVTLPVYASYRFTVTGGDDERAIPYDVVALTPPAILDLRLEVQYPAHLERAPETLLGGDQRVPAGSRVRLRLETSMDVAEATIAYGPTPPRPLERESERRFSADLEAVQDLRYSIRLVGPHGEENDPGIDTFLLRVEKDRAPILRVVTPSVQVERTARGVVLASLLARDDHRVAGAELKVEIGGTERTIPLGGGEEGVTFERGASSSGEVVVALATLDLSRLSLKRGDAVVYRFVATDSAGQAETTPPHRVTIIDERDIVQDAEGGQERLRDSVERTEARAGEARYLASLLRSAVRSEGAVPEDDVRNMAGRAQALQSRVVSDLDSVHASIAGILNLYVFNRLEEGPAVEAILPHYRRHLLATAEEPGAPFKGSLYAALWTATQERAIRPTGSLGKLLEMAELSRALATEHAPAAYRALDRLARRDPEGAPADLIRIVDAEQEQVREGIARLLRLMEEWRSFETVVRFFKNLAETQKEVVRETESLPD